MLTVYKAVGNYDGVIYRANKCDVSKAVQSSEILGRNIIEMNMMEDCIDTVRLAWRSFVD